MNFVTLLPHWIRAYVVVAFFLLYFVHKTKIEFVCISNGNNKKIAHQLRVFEPARIQIMVKCPSSIENIRFDPAIV